MDLLIADERSFEMFLGEMAILYQNPGMALPSLDFSFQDYVGALKSSENTEAFERSREYWVRRIPSLPPSPELPFAKNSTSVRRSVLKRRIARVNADVWRNLKQIGSRFDSTPIGILLAAYTEVLAIWCQNPRFTLNLTLFNRLSVPPQSSEAL